jgi:hypothetical protein
LTEERDPEAVLARLEKMQADMNAWAEAHGLASEVRGPRYYVLDADHQLVPAANIYEWARMLEGSDRIVAQDTLPDGTFISTVFLGLDHGWGKGPPITFETMVFFPKGEGEDSEIVDRCATWADSEAIHAATLRRYTPGGSDD